MPNVTIISAEPQAAPCPRCGGPAGLARGEMTRDDAPYARYLLDWCEAAEPRRAMLTMSIGNWSDGAAPADRTAVGIEMGAEGWRLTDTAERDDLDGWGEFASDSEVRKRGAVDQVRALARLVMADDPNAAKVNAWTTGERETAIPE